MFVNLQNVQENTAKCVDAKEKVKTHPMCLDFEESKHYFVVLFPSCVAGLNGIRIAHGKNKTTALNTLYEKLEKAWKLDNPVLYPEEKEW